MATVHIIVPTVQCADYIGRSFSAIETAAKELADHHAVRLVFVLNGSTKRDEDALKECLGRSSIDSRLIIRELSGKNTAINAGVRSAQEDGAEVVHIIDDDQSYSARAFLINVNTLISMRDRLGIHGLVGSRPIANMGRGFNATAWVARLAFLPEEEAPKFCLGGSICAFAAGFPELPADDSGIADDAYICNEYYVRHRSLFLETGFMPIVFPPGSILYLNVAHDWREYHRQQVRIRYGVLAAYAAYPEHADELRRYFMWRFHCDSRSLRMRKNWRGVGRQLRWGLFKILRARANREAERRLSRGEQGVKWAIARSTK